MLIVCVNHVIPRLDIVPTNVLLDTGETRAHHPVHQTVKVHFVIGMVTVTIVVITTGDTRVTHHVHKTVEVVTGPLVTVTVVVITIGEKRVTRHAHKPVTEACVFKTLGIAAMAAHRDDTEINVNTTVTKNVRGGLVIRTMEYVRTDALNFITGINVRTSVVRIVVPDVVTDIAVHALDVVTAILVRLAAASVA